MTIYVAICAAMFLITAGYATKEKDMSQAMIALALGIAGIYLLVA